MRNFTTKIHEVDPALWKKATLGGIAWTTGAQVAKQVMQFGISIVLARLLTPEDFGLIGMITVFTGFVALFGDSGFASALVQYKDVEERHFSSVFWLNVLAGVILMGIIMAIAPYLASFYNEPRLIPLTLLIATNFFITSFNVIQNMRFQRALNFRILASIESAAILVAGVAAIVLVYSGYGVYALAWQMLVSTATSVAIMWIISDWHPHWMFEWKAVKELWAFSSNLLGFNIFNYWTRSADNLLIGKFVGSAGLGIYARAYSTMLLPLSQVSQVVGRVMFPSLARIQDDKLRIKSIYLRAISIIALLTFPLMLGLLVVADRFVIVLFGPQWMAVAPILRILCPVGMAQSIGTTTGWIYQSQGRTDLLFRWGLVSGTVTFFMFAVGIWWGVWGVAIAYAIRSFALLYFNYMIPGKLIGMHVSEVISAVTGALCCGLMMATAVWLLGLALPESWSYLDRLVIQVLAGGVIYGSLIHFCKLKSYMDMRRLFVEQWHTRRRKLEPTSEPTT